MTHTSAKDRLRFDRADELATTALLWLGVGATAAYALFVGLDWALRTQVTLTDVPLEVPPESAGVGRIVGPVQADVLVEGVSGPHLALLLASGIVVVAAAAWGALLLTRFLRDLGRGEPFSMANVARLRIVAALLVLVPLTTDMLYAIARAEVMGAAGSGQDAGFMFTFTPAWLVAGLLVAAMAQAFATGTRLRADVDGLV